MFHRTTLPKYCTLRNVGVIPPNESFFLFQFNSTCQSFCWRAGCHTIVISNHSEKKERCESPFIVHSKYPSFPGIAVKDDEKHGSICAFWYLFGSRCWMLCCLYHGQHNIIQYDTGMLYWEQRKCCPHNIYWVGLCSETLKRQYMFPVTWSWRNEWQYVLQMSLLRAQSAQYIAYMCVVLVPAVYFLTYKYICISSWSYPHLLWERPTPEIELNNVTDQNHGHAQTLFIPSWDTP